VTFGGNERAARERLQAQIRDALNASVNIRTVKDVVSLERDVIMNEVLNNVAKRAEPLGVKIVDVRLKRIEFAPEISESVYRRMESERVRVANELRSIGAAEGERIRAEADREREQILAKAYGRAEAIMGEGEAEAAGLYAKAYGADLPFFSFYKSLEGYRSAFGKPGDVLVVDPSSDFFKYLKNPEGKK
jgi:membrane protease subunit HflC